MVGGGQLARMTCQAAIALGVDFRILVGSASDSAAQIWSAVTLGDYRSLSDVASFAAGCDVLTFDHEHVPGDVLSDLRTAGVVLRPGPDALRYTQDKLAMRDRLSALGLPCPRYTAIKNLADIEAFGSWPVVLKAVSGGYDGKGVWVCSSAGEARDVLSHSIELMVEEFVPFERELAVLAARSPHKQGAVYPVVQTVQQDGICREVIAPAPGLDGMRAALAQELALRIAAELDVTGLLAVELFDTGDGLLINELAMRPHNCGHWTIDGARTSQFEQHLRAVLDLPLGSTDLSAPVTVMANVLGGSSASASAAASTSASAADDVYDRYTHVMAADPGVKVHMYGKEPRPGRKIGHVTVSGGDVRRVRERARRAASFLRWGTEDGE